VRALVDKFYAPLVVLGVLVLTVGIGSLFYLYEQMRASATDTRGDPVLVGAGDISDCRNDNDEATAKLLDDIEGTVFTAGDNVYRSGTYAEYMDCYDPTWGRHKGRTKPAPGNHGYNTEGASGYFNYFGAAAGDPNKGYYSYDLGEWHIVVLNSMCEEVGGCEETSPQITWLKQELANNQTACTLAIWHHPLFSSGGEHGSDPKMQAAWDALYAANAELVVNGHDHDYERFAPQTPSAVADPTNGIREFVVGTGGGSLDGLGTKRANSEVFNDDTYGVLKLTLHSGSYDWEFVPEAGKSFSDSGTTGCH
jgi:3',5'-cyclic AMP phosphodiesterase CpdA